MLTIKEVLSHAQEACDHARKQIYKGTTHIAGVANAPDEYRGSKDVDEALALREGIIATRELVELETDNKNPLEKNAPYLAGFETAIEISSKYSLGNCIEYAYHAMDYILNHNVDINAEIFKIMRGDHFFLVLNRDPGSNRNNPETWGENAVICDPWQNKVYPAKDFQQQLKGYFDSSKGHKLTARLSSETLREFRTIDNLKKNYFDEVKSLMTSLMDYKTQITTQRQLLAWRDWPIVTANIKKVDTLIDELKNEKCNEYDGMDYRTAKAGLTDKLDLLSQKIAYIIQFQPTEKERLGFFSGTENKSEKRPDIQITVEQLESQLKKLQR